MFIQYTVPHGVRGDLATWMMGFLNDGAAAGVVIPAGAATVVGIGVGCAFAIFGYSSTYGLAVALDAVDSGQMMKAALACGLLGWIVAVVAAIYPSRVAARMVPADALRTEI